MNTSGNKVNLFITWSKEPSKTIAKHLQMLLVDVLHIRPFMSDVDIESGSAWFKEICGGLSQSDRGIVLLAANSLDSPWVWWEAGALAGRTGFGNVHSVLVNITSANVPSPLDQYQHTICTDKAQVKKLVDDLRQFAVPDHCPVSMDRVFESQWPEFSRRVDEAIRAAGDAATPPKLSQDAMLEQILGALKAMQASPPRWESRPDAVGTGAAKAPTGAYDSSATLQPTKPLPTQSPPYGSIVINPTTGTTTIHSFGPTGPVGPTGMRINPGTSGNPLP